MFEARCKNTGLVNVIFELPSKNATRLTSYSQFGIHSCGHGAVVLEARYKTKGLVKVTFESPSTNATRLAED